MTSGHLTSLEDMCDFTRWECKKRQASWASC